MAMKVTNKTIHRLSVDMSCGCRMFAEFEDANCKTPVGYEVDLKEDGVEEKPLPFDRTFIACKKHETDAAVSMLEFIIGERLDEAVESARKSPPIVQHLHSIPQSIEVGESGGVMATGDSVQVVSRVQKPNAVRPRGEIGVKTLQRSPEQIAKSAGMTVTSGNSMSVSTGEMQLDEVPEDEAITPHIADLFDSLDTRESGLFSDDGEGNPEDYLK